MNVYLLRTQRALLHGMPPVQPSPAAPSVLNDLRAGTHTLHVALEQRLPFFSDTLDLERYTRLLGAYFGFYEALEDRLMRSAFIPAGFDLLFNGCFPLVMGRIPGVNRRPAMAGIGLFLFHGITFWVCNPARKVVQYDCRVDCIHFCGQADLWKRSRCWRTGGVFLWLLRLLNLYYVKHVYLY